MHQSGPRRRSVSIAAAVFGGTLRRVRANRLNAVCPLATTGTTPSLPERRHGQFTHRADPPCGVTPISSPVIREATAVAVDLCPRHRIATLTRERRCATVLSPGGTRISS
jgi:hypothetical protein